jgi:cytochrome c peroxidase
VSRPAPGFLDSAAAGDRCLRPKGPPQRSGAHQSAWGRGFFWDSRITTLEEQVLRPIQDPLEMDMTLEEVSSRVGLDRLTISQALASYVRSILSGDAPYDRFINGSRRALSSVQRRGLQVFQGKGNCTACHVGPTFSDERLHNTGIAWQADASVPGGTFTDLGRFIVTSKPEDRGAFKTPTLREVARTAPYMHDGSLPTLEAVVNFYSDGGRKNPNLDPEIRPLRLTPLEKRDLVAFLKSLSGRVRDGN